MPKLIRPDISSYFCVAGHTSWSGTLGSRGNTPFSTNSQDAYRGYLIKWDNSESIKLRRQFLESKGFSLNRNIHKNKPNENGIVLDWIEAKAGVNEQAALRGLENRPGIAFVEKNWKIGTLSTAEPNDPDLGNLWGLQGGFGSDATTAWADGLTGSSNVYVGVIDEGIAVKHSDLDDNIGVDPSGNNGYDFYSGDANVSDGTVNHGTHVAGTIGAEGNNGAGVVGVNWDVSMLSGQFLGPEGGYTSDAILAVDYFTNLKNMYGYNIVATNNSWGGGGFSQGLYDAIGRAEEADILFIAAAGNSNTSDLSYPAAYGVNNTFTSGRGRNRTTTTYTALENVISVGSITSSGARSSFSNYGNWVDIGAPGSSILSTVSPNNYSTYSGTSMASPHVTGAAALLKAAIPSATGSQIKQAILEGGIFTASLDGGITSTGKRLNIPGAIEMLESITGKTAGGGGTNPPEPEPDLPIVTLTVGDAEINEGESNGASFTITRSTDTPIDQSLEVFVTWNDPNGSLGSNKPNSYNIAEGQTLLNISLSAPDDGIYTGNQTVEVFLTQNASYQTGDPSLAEFTVLENDAAPPTTQDPITTFAGDYVLFDEITGRQKFFDEANSGFGLESYARTESQFGFDPNINSIQVQQSPDNIPSGKTFNGWFFHSKYSFEGVNGLAVFADLGAQTNLSGRSPDADDDMVAFIAGWTYKGKTFLGSADEAGWIEVVS